MATADMKTEEVVDDPFTIEVLYSQALSRLEKRKEMLATHAYSVGKVRAFILWNASA